jgi:hypothetical protein
MYINVVCRYTQVNYQLILSPGVKYLIFDKILKFQSTKAKIPCEHVNL